MKEKSAFRLLLLFLFAFAALPAIAQVPKFKDAVAYNDYIVAQQSAVGEKIAAFNEAVSNVELSIEEIRVFHKALHDQTLQAVANVKAMGGYAGSTQLRDAALVLYQFYERMVANEYNEMLGIVTQASPSEADLARLDELLQKITAEEGPLDEAYLAAQQSFADKHNFLLEAPVEGGTEE